MNVKPELKSLPVFTTDEEAEDFVAHADLSDYDLSGMKPAGFEYQRKDVQINLRMPASLVDALKSRAKDRGIPYQRLIREALEGILAKK